MQRREGGMRLEFGDFGLLAWNGRTQLGVGLCWFFRLSNGSMRTLALDGAGLEDGVGIPRDTFGGASSRDTMTTQRRLEDDALAGFLGYRA